MQIPFPNVNLIIVGICALLSLVLLSLMWKDISSRAEKNQHIILIAFTLLVSTLMLILYSK